MNHTPLLEMSGITKSFPGVIANDNVNLSIRPGEIHALFGENGAGKSTLVKIIYGILRPDHGTMRFSGIPYSPSRPFEARAQGVGMVFQHFSLFEALSVAENIALGMNKGVVGADLDYQITEVSNAYGLALDPKRYVGSLSVGERQRVEIIRCLLQNPRLLIMDEPTSVLTPQEVRSLFKTLRQLSAEGCSILYISHKLEEIRILCSQATVLRGGEVVGVCDPSKETAKSLAEMMIGSTLTFTERKEAKFGDECFVAESLSVQNQDPFGVDLKNISLTVRAGEILGIAGVAGNGQVELMETLSGERTITSGSMFIGSEPIDQLGPTGRRRLGMCMVPEERLGHGAAPEMSLWENAMLSARTRKGMEKNGFLDIEMARDFAREVADAFNVKTAGINNSANSLSGGNLQKFIVGREILQNPSVLIALQPTWGVDAAAATAIHRSLQELANAGTAVLVISQDLDELMVISNKFAVLSEGCLSEITPTGTLSIEEIGLLMGGAQPGVSVEDGK